MAKGDKLDTGDTVPEGELAELGQASGAVAGDVDPAALLASITALQTRLAALEGEKAAAAVVPIIATAQALLDDLLEHASGKTLGYQDPDSHAAILGLAQDALAAARETQASGDGTALTQIAQRIDRQLSRTVIPGDHHWLRQAQSQAADLYDQASELHAAQADSGRKVLTGTVVGLWPSVTAPASAAPAGC